MSAPPPASTPAAVGLGSNQGDRAKLLGQAVHTLGALPGVDGLRCSPWYETEPVGMAPGTAPFLNGAVLLSYAGDARELLSALQTVETALGRPGVRTRNESRLIDLDLLWFGDARLEEPGLLVPHPRLSQRRFVLQPLCDLCPEHVLPGHLLPLRELLRLLPAADRVMACSAAQV